jgi:hypothetical protein
MAPPGGCVGQQERRHYSGFAVKKPSGSRFSPWKNLDGRYKV